MKQRSMEKRSQKRRVVSNTRAIYLLSPKLKEGTTPLPMITFETVAKSIEFSTCDTLMFTSKQAVITANEIDPHWQNIPTIAIGPATKRQIEQLGGRVMYQPKDFYGQSLAEDIYQYFKERKILYLRPKKVSFDSKSYLAQRDINLQEQIIYQTSCVAYNKERQPPKNSIIIFTSPSTIECFLSNFAWQESYTAVVIGDATKAHLPKGAEYRVAKEPLIDACVQMAREICRIL